MNEEDLFDMSDEDLEAAFKEAKATQDSPETALEDDNVGTEEVIDEDVQEDIVDEIDDADLEEEVDELEQPDVDSDDDTSDDDIADEDTDEDSETDEDELDGDIDEEDEQPEDEKPAEVEAPQPVAKRKFRANNVDYELTEAEMMEQFPKIFGQAMNYTQKTQKIKPWTKTIDAIEQANLSHDDINLAIEVLKGDKNAIASLLKRTSVDALDLETDNDTDYVPKDYGRSETELEIKDIVDKIGGETEFKYTESVVTGFDEASRNQIAARPELLDLLHVDVKSGMYDKINPIAQKLKVYDSGRADDLKYYELASKQYFQEEAQSQKVESDRAQAAIVTADREAEQQRVQEVKAKAAKRLANKKASTARKAAAPTKKAAGTKKSTSLLDESEEGFDDWYKALQERM